ncbi:hypothetical protein C8J56DRAFT_827656 [Mycena floridula]|nr:hypothetical protein C8J56DRAFT_827656 [Mycena floridula]
MARFAQEIIDIVIDFGHDNPGLLANCSLVCRSWVPSARHHIFETISLREYSDHGWRSIIESTIQTVTQHVKVVKIDATNSWGDQSWPLSRFKPSFERLTLRSLHLRSIQLQSSDFYDCLSSVTEIHLGTVSSVTRNDIFDFLASFPSLETVSLTLLRFPDAEPNTILPAAPQSLTSVTLNLEDEALRVAIQWLIGRGSPKITTLTVKQLAFTSVLQPLLNMVSEVLVNLDIDGAQQCTGPPLDLSSHKDLRNLRLTPWRGFRLNDTPPFSVMECVSSCQALDTFTLCIKVVHPEEIPTAFPWKELDDLLAGSRFDGLKEVRCSALCTQLGWIPEPSIEPVSLPQCQARGILVTRNNVF